MDKAIRNELMEIRSRLKDELKKSRFEHSLGVEFTSASLAMRYGADIYKARIAGLLHDCAKNVSDDKQLDLCKKYKLPISDTEKSFPIFFMQSLGHILLKRNMA